MSNVMAQIAELQGEIIALLNMELYVREKVNELQEQKQELEKQL